MPSEMKRGRTCATSPYAILATGVVVVLVLEYFRGSATFDTAPEWPIAQAIVTGVALLAVWPTRDDLGLAPVLALGAALQLGWIVVHLHLGVHGDHDPNTVYSVQGEALLHGHYPHSEYPPGAVGLFALEALLGRGSATTPNAFLMVPFQLVCVAGIWALRTQWAPWLATVVALWPLNAFFWEFRFDLLPTAALVAGLVLAHRDRWLAGGAILGLGAITKWTPAFACLALVLWLLRKRRVRAAEAHLLGFAAPVLIANVPIFLWDRSALFDAYSTQGARTVTAESFVYLPLRLFWDVHPGIWYFRAADVPSAANTAAIWLQIVAVGVVLMLTALATRRSSAVALAGLAPAVFLLTNRIFSPQFYVLVLAAVFIAAALLARSGLEVLLIALLCAVATAADTILYQSYLGAQPVASLPSWMYISAASYLPAFAAIVWLAFRALPNRKEPVASEVKPGTPRHA
jgi:hypothetical protein